MNIALCLLTWNEIEGCRYDVPRLKFDAFDEIFAIDKGSTDGTVEYLELQGIVVYKQDIPTYNGAYFCAFQHCRSDALILFHPKGSIDPDETLKFRSYFEQGYDLVVASRIISVDMSKPTSQSYQTKLYAEQKKYCPSLSEREASLFSVNLIHIIILRKNQLK